MVELNLTILYVDDPVASAAFYADLLGQPPDEASPTFAMFKLPSGASIGLWSRHTVEPGAEATGGGAELAFVATNVDAIYALWVSRGLPVIQPPTELDFGRTFVALDPDRHRLRVFAPVMAEQQSPSA